MQIYQVCFKFCITGYSDKAVLWLDLGIHWLRRDVPSPVLGSQSPFYSFHARIPRGSPSQTFSDDQCFSPQFGMLSVSTAHCPTHFTQPISQTRRTLVDCDRWTHLIRERTNLSIHLEPLGSPRRTAGTECL